MEGFHPSGTTSGGGGGGGAVAPTVSTKTSNFTAADGGIYEVDASGGAVTATVPVTSGLVCFIKKIDSSANAVSIVPASGTIDGGASISLTAQYEAREVAGDGTNAIAIAERKVFGTPVSVGTANSAGTSNKMPREDHVHDGTALLETDSAVVHQFLFGG